MRNTTIEEQKRGQLTERVQAKAVELLGRDIDVAELRLMPYVQHVMMNEQRIDTRHTSGTDRQTLSKWRDEGHIEGGASGLAITKEFWDILNEILFLAYVDTFGES